MALLTKNCSKQKLNSQKTTMGRFKNLKKMAGKKFYHVGKIELDGPGGPKPERCSMKNSMYSVAIH
jgi:hypothetical protein